MVLLLALLAGSFRLLSDFSSDTIAAHQPSADLGPIHNIRHLLTSSDPNEQYLFLSCIQCLEPDLWAGTSPSRPAVLEEWEVERVMKFLDSADTSIRKMVNIDRIELPFELFDNSLCTDAERSAQSRHRHCRFLFRSILPRHTIRLVSQRQERICHSFIGSFRDSMWRRW